MVDLLRRPATELAGLVRDGEITARELVESSLARIEAVNGELNAYVLTDAEHALATADAIGPGDERPFAGVPIAIKDLFAPVAGLPMRQGSDLLGDYTPDYDYALVRRFREAGFVIVGKTNTPELGILPVTEPRRFGPARNPWDRERTTGGSSGGSAAAVAGGTVPVAHASDGGGSIRIPAACCGLVGLKPSRGRISRAPDLGDHFLATDGALTRTVADSAALLDVMAGYESGDSTWAPPPAEPFAAAGGRDPGKLRIGMTLDRPIDCDLDPQCERATRDAAELLSSLGHEVEEVDGPWAQFDLLPIFTVLWTTSVALGALHAQMVTGNGPSEENLEPLTWELYRQGNEHSAPVYLGALATLQRFSRTVVGLWSDYDVVLTPTLAQRPVRHGEIDSMGEDPMHEFKKSGEFTPYTAIFNVTGQPAISVPLYQGDDGLPLPVHLVGAPAREDVLLALAAQLEDARPWAQRTPDLAASS